MKDANNRQNLYKLRALQEGDIDQNYIRLLQGVNPESLQAPIERIQECLNRFMEIKSDGNYHIWVMERKKDHKVVASGLLMIEKKFYRNCANVGHIEDIVVSDDIRSEGLGKEIVKKLIEEAQKLGCYKVTLSCSEKTAEFYRKCGFNNEEKSMKLYLNNLNTQ